MEPLSRTFNLRVDLGVGVCFIDLRKACTEIFFHGADIFSIINRLNPVIRLCFIALSAFLVGVGVGVSVGTGVSVGAGVSDGVGSRCFAWLRGHRRFRRFASELVSGVSLGVGSGVSLGVGSSGVSARSWILSRIWCFRYFWLLCGSCSLILTMLLWFFPRFLSLLCSTAGAIGFFCVLHSPFHSVWTVHLPVLSAFPAPFSPSPPHEPVPPN